MRFLPLVIWIAGCGAPVGNSGGSDGGSDGGATLAAVMPAGASDCERSARWPPTTSCVHCVYRAVHFADCATASQSASACAPGGDACYATCQSAHRDDATALCACYDACAPGCAAARDALWSCVIAACAASCM